MGNLKLTHSAAANSSVGKEISTNTTRSNNVAFKSFCQHIFKLRNENVERNGEDWNIFEKAKPILFPGIKKGHKNWTENQQKNFRYFLVDYIVTVQNSSMDGSLKPTELSCRVLSNDLSIKRALSTFEGFSSKLLNGPTFHCKDEGLRAVIDSKKWGWRVWNYIQKVTTFSQLRILVLFSIARLHLIILPKGTKLHWLYLSQC